MVASKYSPELVEAIVNAIAVEGGDQSGWEAGGISKDTFYRWIKERSDFADQIAHARSEYASTRPVRQIRKARRALDDYLSGNVIEEWDVYHEAVTPLGDVVMLHDTKRIKRGVPKWAIERVLGKPLDLLEALETLANLEIIPRWVVQKAADEIRNARTEVTEALRGQIPADGHSKRPGVSDETAGIIRGHIMGVDAKSLAALSGEVGQRQVKDQNLSEVETHRD